MLFLLKIKLGWTCDDEDAASEGQNGEEGVEVNGPGGDKGLELHILGDGVCGWVVEDVGWVVNGSVWDVAATVVAPTLCLHVQNLT